MKDKLSRLSEPYLADLRMPLTHEVLPGQEHEERRLSHQRHDEIAPDCAGRQCPAIDLEEGG